MLHFESHIILYQYIQYQIHIRGLIKTLYRNENEPDMSILYEKQPTYSLSLIGGSRARETLLSHLTFLCVVFVKYDKNTTLPPPS